MARLWADSGRFRKGKGRRCYCYVCISRARRSTKRSEVVRCRTGIVTSAESGTIPDQRRTASRCTASGKPKIEPMNLATKTRDQISFVTPKVAVEIEAWLVHLGAERRLSPQTLEAYRRDVLQFLHFLAEHLGGAPSLKELAALEPADIRAFMAARRSDGIGSR